MHGLSAFVQPSEFCLSKGYFHWHGQSSRPEIFNTAKLTYYSAFDTVGFMTRDAVIFDSVCEILYPKTTAPTKVPTSYGFPFLADLMFASSRD